MKQKALGMIETMGLVPAIEGGDAGVKAANVQLLGYEIVKGGLVMVAFVGDVAAVKASVSAGSVAAAKVGLVVSEHVIPRPEADLRMVFKGNSSQPENDDPGPDSGKIKKHCDVDLDDKLVKDEMDGEDALPCPQSPSSDSASVSAEDETRIEAKTEIINKTESTGDRLSVGDNEDLELMTVGELRRLARKTPGILIIGREISRANKKQLIKEILQARGGKD